MDTLTLYRMPDELTETHVTIPYHVAINGVAVIQTTLTYPRGVFSPEPTLPDDLQQVIWQMEKALQVPCLYRDLRIQPPSSRVGGAGIRLVVSR